MSYFFERACAASHARVLNEKRRQLLEKDCAWSMELTETPDRWSLELDLLPHNAPADLTETIFSLTNGYFGCRGAAPFAPRGTRGSYINGLYAEAPAAIAWIPRPGSRSRDSARFPDDASVARCGKKWALVAAPNLFFVETPSAARPISESLLPTLDLRTGLLRFAGEIVVDGLCLRVEARRFLDRTNHHRAFERIRLVEADGKDIVVQCGIDDSVRTMRNRKAFDLWESREFTRGDDMIVWRGITRGHGMECALACGCEAIAGTVEPEQRQDGSPVWRCRGNGVVEIVRVVSAATSSLEPDPRRTARTECEAGIRMGWDAAFAGHSAAWRECWRRGDIVIDGPRDDQRAIRYALFQTMSSFSGLSEVSIGAKFLSHEGYVGGVYWDTDIFVVPYMIRAFPEHARNHLIFRWRGLDAAREKARRFGYRGALYAWSSLPDGQEATAPWLVIDRTQMHVVGAVAWGVAEYMRWTGDQQFMDAYGREILAETARFWVSKMDADGGVRTVCGPDEACPEVDNNAYTNRLAAANLRWAARYADDSVEAAEKAAWLRAADAMIQQAPDQRGVIEQFDRYHETPELQRAKQADVMMLPVVFPDLLTPRQIAANYAYYEPRCAHGSSLSEGAYALCAARAGFDAEAYELFQRCLFMDLHNLHGNTLNGGLHAGCNGFVATVIAQGFCGLRLTTDGPVCDPRLPDQWRSAAFTICYRGRERLLRLENQARPDRTPR
jgi:trehalose/maltose hydrolase-like predicted phosphorylase